jgi:chaperonin GroEL
VAESLQAPIRQILSNAHIDNIDAIVSQIRRGEGGYNLNTLSYDDFIAAGIIDPVKVIRVALENANSVASMIIGSAGLVAETKNI